MTAGLLDGDALAAQWRAALKSDVAHCRRRPCLAIVQVGADAPSTAYVARKHADCREVGMVSLAINLPADITQGALADQVGALNADPMIDAVLVQLPLPAGLDVAAIQAMISPAKDVDGLTPANQAALFASRPGLRPCTPSAILGLLAARGVALAGRHVVVIGRGPLVGRPLAAMLAAPDVNAAPTVLHRGVTNLAAFTRQADIIVAAAGAPNLVTAAMVKPGAAVVGVGISYVAGQMLSDVAADVAGIAAWVTPTHGSIGALTRAQMLRNTLAAANARA